MRRDRRGLTSSPWSRSSTIRFFSRVIVGLYFIEVGLLLTIAPWMGWLQQNYFADRLVWLRAAMNMPAWRALVVITGLVTVLAGMTEVWQAIGQRLARGRQPDA